MFGLQLHLERREDLTSFMHKCTSRSNAWRRQYHCWDCQVLFSSAFLTKMYGLQSFGGRRRISRCSLEAAIKSNGSAQVIANVRCHTSSNYMMSSTALQSFDIACEYLFIHKLFASASNCIQHLIKKYVCVNTYVTKLCKELKKWWRSNAWRGAIAARGVIIWNHPPLRWAGTWYGNWGVCSMYPEVV